MPIRFRQTSTRLRPPLRVFISSTYRDLVQYREVLKTALETSGYVPVGMESFPAQDCSSLDACLAVLDTANVYVGIIGQLYGSSPPRRAKSYTEFEYDHAIARAMYKIVLIMDDDAEVRRAHVEQDAKRVARLERLRKRIMKNQVVQTFRDPHEAAWKILAALRTYEARISETGGIRR